MPNTAERQAQYQIESIVQLIRTYNDWDKLENLFNEWKYLTKEANDCLDDNANVDPAFEKYFEEAGERIKEITKELADYDIREEGYLSQDDVLEDIHAFSLDVSYRSGWVSDPQDMEAEEFKILLCTGGPHVELRGDIHPPGEVTLTSCLYKDWGENGEYYIPEEVYPLVQQYCEMVVTV